MAEIKYGYLVSADYQKALPNITHALKTDAGFRALRTEAAKAYRRAEGVQFDAAYEYVDGELFTVDDDVEAARRRLSKMSRPDPREQAQAVALGTEGDADQAPGLIPEGGIGVSAVGTSRGQARAALGQSNKLIEDAYATLFGTNLY